MKNSAKGVFSITLLLLVSLSLPSRLQASSSLIKNLVFTTESRAALPGTISEAITVQSQNAEGAAEKVDETNDVTFTTTSGTGEFLGATGNEATKTMAKNTASRTFYYRDSTAGTYTLTISIKGRDSGKTFEATQSIKIGEGGNTETEDDTDGSDTTEEGEENKTGVETESGGSSSSGSSASSHSSNTSLSSITEKLPFKADAGRKRTAIINTEVEFKAKVTSSESGKNSDYVWSFGDGTSAYGKVVTHSYAFPGNYNVVLNVNIGEYDAVSRTEIKIVNPEISVSDVKFGKGGSVEISNNSGGEINIGSWKLQGSTSTLVLAKDTILKPKAKLRLPFSTLDEEANQELSFMYPNNVVAVSVKPSIPKNNVSLERAEEIKNKIAALQAEIEKIRKIEINNVVTNTAENRALPSEIQKIEQIPIQANTTSTPVTLLQAGTTTGGTTSDQSASLINAFEKHEEKQGVLDKIINIFK